MASCRTFLTFASVTIPLTGGSLIPWQYASKCVCYHQPGGKVGYVCLCRRKLLELVQIKDCFVHHVARDCERRRHTAQTHRLGESICSISQISDNSQCDVLLSSVRAEKEDAINRPLMRQRPQSIASRCRPTCFSPPFIEERNIDGFCGQALGPGRKG